MQPTMDELEAIGSREQLAGVVGQMHRAGIGSFFGVGASPDMKNSKMVIAQAGEGGLSLPDRDYYLKKDDAKLADVRAKYERHIEKTLGMAGHKDAANAAKAILRCGIFAESFDHRTFVGGLPTSFGPRMMLSTVSICVAAGRAA